MAVRILALDPGEEKTALALVEGKDPLAATLHEGTSELYVLLLKRLGNESLEETLRNLVGETPPGLAVVERPLRVKEAKRVLAKKGRAFPKDRYMRLAQVTASLVRLLRELQVPTLTLIAVSRTLEDEERGWRQAFTGLLRPSEEDVTRELEALYRLGKLKGPRPRGPHEADALGMAVWAWKGLRGGKG